MDLEGVTLTMAREERYTFPLAITFQSYDQDNNKCVTFEIRSIETGSNQEKISIVNQQDYLQHMIPTQPSFPKYGSLKYQVRSRKSGLKSAWSEALVICDEELTEIGEIEGHLDEVTSDEYFTFY